MRELAGGIAAGAVGITALNAATYLDMLARGRPASSLPTDAAAKLAERLSFPVSDHRTAPNRQEAVGALLGIATGVGVGASYGLLRSRAALPFTIAAPTLTVAAMAGSDLPMAALGLTNPRTWDASSWVSDVLPHLAYGVATAAAYRLFDK